MKRSTLFLTSGLFVFVLVLFTGGNAGSKNMEGELVPEIVVEGKGPLVESPLETNVVSMDYYGIDYNCDGNGDSAIGSPLSSVNGQSQAGSVNVLYGTGTGLVKKGNQLWTLGTIGLNPVAGDGFGYAIAS